MSVLGLYSMDNKTGARKRYPHGRKLDEFAELFTSTVSKFAGENDCKPSDFVFIRERGFSRFAAETQTIFRMVGVTDLLIWRLAGKSFDQIAPKEVKKFVAGDGKATKVSVAASLPYYVGDIQYASDDESDAVAVGIAWLIKNGYEVQGRGN